MALNNIVNATTTLKLNPEKVLENIQGHYGVLFRELGSHRGDWDNTSDPLNKIAYLQDFTGVKPNEDIVQETYAHFFNGMKDNDLKTVTKLKSITGIEPSEPIIQEGYESNITMGCFNSLRYMYNLTDIRPLLKTIQEGYVSYLEEGQIEKVRLLQEVTGVSPSTKAYESYLRYLIEEINM